MAVRICVLIFRWGLRPQTPRRHSPGPIARLRSGGATPCVAFVLAIGLVGCTPPETDRAGVSSGTETVALTVDHRSEWRVLWIEGETDLPDGAEVSYRVTHSVARTTASEDWPARNLIESGRSSVQDGQYWSRLNTLNWPAGDVEIVVQFPLPPQPSEVDARYGEFGEHLTGENVTDLGGMKAVEVTHVFEHQR